LIARLSVLGICLVLFVFPQAKAAGGNNPVTLSFANGTSLTFDSVEREEAKLKCKKAGCTLEYSAESLTPTERAKYFPETLYSPWTPLQVTNAPASPDTASVSTASPTQNPTLNGAAPTATPLPATDVAHQRGRPLIGVERWDMYSGDGYTQDQELGYLPGGSAYLKPEEWHVRAPFFCRLTKDVTSVKHPEGAGPIWFNYPYNQELLQKSMDQEIRYAYDAGIDFFIYHGPSDRLTHGGWGLLKNLHAQMSSQIPEAKKMHFVWALYGENPAMKYTSSRVATMMDETIEYIKMPNWQRVMDDRPLVIVFYPENFNKQLAAAPENEQMTGNELVDYIRKRVTDAGMKNPYVVGMAISGYDKAEDYKKWGYDAFMNYDGSYGGKIAKRDQSPTYAEATASITDVLEKKFSATGLPYIPPFSSMEYPWPRAINTKTHQIEEKHYHYQLPKKGDMAARIKTALDYVSSHPKECEAQVLSMYSWNECSEGGGLIPTMGKPPEYQPDTTWLDEVAGALAAWKYPSGSTDTITNTNR